MNFGSISRYATTTTTTTNYPHTLVRLLIVRFSSQRRKGQSRLSRAWAEERPGRMRHGRWGRAHGWASVPPTASQTIAASSVDAAWGSGHHQETHMWGTEGLPSPHATNCHAVAYEPRRRRTTCACHTRDQTHTHHATSGARERGGEWGGWGREHAASRVGHQHMGKSRVCSRKSRWGCEV